MPTKTKRCLRCQVEKKVELFTQLPYRQRKKGEDNRKDVCIACIAEQTAEELSRKTEDRVVERAVEKVTAAERAKIVSKQARDRTRERKKRADAKRALEKEARAAARQEILEKKRLAKAVRRKKAKATVQQREMASRTLARRRLIHYIRRKNPKYLAGWVHQDICSRLERFTRQVEAGESPRLMLFMPPRHGKSMIASVNYPAWALGNHPDWEIINASYAVSLPLGFSRQVRQQIREKDYRELFPDLNLDPDSQAAEAWRTLEGGGFLAAGIGGGITGKGAHVFIVDDPIKDAQEADSETIRDTVWDWYGPVAYTRLAPGGGVLVIQTRWHDDDLSGRLLVKMKEDLKEAEELGMSTDDIDQWEIVEYPATATHDEYHDEHKNIVRVDPELQDPPPGATIIREKGAPLHEERFNLSRLNRIKRTLQPRHWSALYMQNPVPEEGIFFLKEHQRFETTPPTEMLYTFSAWDLAIGERNTNDYTVGIVGGIDWRDKLHILEMVRGRLGTFDIVEAILNVYARYPNMIKMGIERGQLEMAIKPVLKRRMRERRLYPPMAEGKEALVPITDKMVRARPLQGRMQQGLVVFPPAHTAPWVEVVWNELLRFPGGIHDDIVDALAWLARLVAGQAPPPSPSLPTKSWKEKLKVHIAGGDVKDPMAA